MRYFVYGLGALLFVGCRTHTVDACLPECDVEDQTFFATCVANGIEDGCLAGNRQCCALAAECVGPLDDQLVVSNTQCQQAMEDACYPPCDAIDEELYAACLSDGSSLCSPDDDRCCAETSDCIGMLADWVIEGPGCCDGVEDCASNEVCDPMTWTCEVTTGGFCGDETTDPDEACDDGNDATETCAYGEMSCQVCAAGCVLAAGATSFCGDGTIDSAHETCDPPGTACDRACQRMVPAHCSNRRQDVDETDVDCGGPDCEGCAPDFHCLMDRDCRALYPECSPTVTCSTLATGAPTCIEIDGCDSGDPCLVDSCEPGTGCVSVDLDADGDGHGPLSCGGSDCDDFNRGLTPDNMFDVICDGLDQDCDTLIDEDC
jgi:hypothetical protein